MSKNAMAGAVTLCGVGLCTIGAALLMQNGQQAHAAAGAMPAAAAAVAATASAQAGPTVVWYAASQPRYYRDDRLDISKGYDIQYIYRAWSDGTVEYRTVKRTVETWAPGCPSCTYYTVASHYCEDAGQCVSPWIVCASPTEGFKAAADIDGDELVGGDDLASVLGNWGDAPRAPFPPSDCPLNLINP